MNRRNPAGHLDRATAPQMARLMDATMSNDQVFRFGSVDDYIRHMIDHATIPHTVYLDVQRQSAVIDATYGYVFVVSFWTDDKERCYGFEQMIGEMWPDMDDLNNHVWFAAQRVHNQIRDAAQQHGFTVHKIGVLKREEDE